VHVREEESPLVKKGKKKFWGWVIGHVNDAETDQAVEESTGMERGRGEGTPFLEGGKPECYHSITKEKKDRRRGRPGLLKSERTEGELTIHFPEDGEKQGSGRPDMEGHRTGMGGT